MRTLRHFLACLVPGKEPDSSTASLLRGGLCTSLDVLRSWGEEGHGQGLIFSGTCFALPRNELPLFT